mgnify:CR=1 FL=1|jgi:hypothetical protein
MANPSRTTLKESPGLWNIWTFITGRDCIPPWVTNPRKTMKSYVHKMSTKLVQDHSLLEAL